MRLGLLTAVVLFFSCSPAVTPKPSPTIEPLPSFELTDVNPASTTSETKVGPLSVRGKVSGWYFTHST